MSILHTILHFTWALPQTLLGLILRGCGYKEITDCNYPELFIEVSWLKDSNFSLGRHVFIHGDFWGIDFDTIHHELGHSRQSLILGPLYLPVIALPSLMWHVWYYYIGKPKCSYYWFYTERWANRLAGIEIE